MIRIAAYLLAGIGAGLGLAYWQGIGFDNGEFGAGLAADSTAPLERRLSELETSIALERYERQALANELSALREAVAAAASSDGNEIDADSGRGPRLAAVAADDEMRTRLEERMRGRFPDGVPQTTEEREALQQQRQLERFVEAGLTAERAQWVMQREEELQMEVLRARYEATQGGAAEEDVANLSITGLLRQELGDVDYERYLDGLGRPTTINVREVLTNSPAQTAGLQPGDEIVAYDGRRVFEMNELNSLINESSPGKTVPLQVMRDGQPVQVYVESGPIGITGGGRSNRRGFQGR